jgi:chromosome partitioning protein
MRKIAVLNQKGGVGKTTTVVNIAAALANAGLRVLAIDLDPQGHLTTHLGVNPDQIQSGSYRVLTQSAEAEAEMMLVRLNLWLLPANINLVGAETELVSIVGRETILREALASAEDKFDYCIIDCAPSLGLLTLNAMAATNEILIPLQPHFLALQGLGKLLQTVSLVNKRINPDLRVKWVLLCMFESRASLPNEVKADIEQFLSSARNTNCAWSEAEILPVYVRRNIKLAEAPSYGQTIFEYDPSCNGAIDYLAVARLIEPRVQVKAAEQKEKVLATPRRFAKQNETQGAAQGYAENTKPLAESPQKLQSNFEDKSLGNPADSTRPFWRDRDFKKTPIEIVEIANTNSQPEAATQVQPATDTSLPGPEPANNKTL